MCLAVAGRAQDAPPAPAKPETRPPSAPTSPNTQAAPEPTAPTAPAAPATPIEQAAPTAPAFSFDQLRERAHELAKHDYVQPSDKDLPQWLAKLDYDAYQRLRYRLETSLWSGDGLPFRVKFMHRGYLFKHRVTIRVIDGSEVRELRFNPAQFDYGEDSKPVPDDLGYAGFAILSRFGDSPQWDEITSFLGASYFRALGAGQTYGASARGLAIDTVTPQGEEFPEFTEFWIEKPAAESRQIRLYALLDSPGLAGAYQFVVTPGAETTVDVTASLWPRHPVEKLCVAPLTTMFQFGEDGQHRMPDYRPEVHDSDGLLLDDGHGQWLWRPLRNPEHTHHISRFVLENPAGFGLLQRDRAFTSYEDLQARFETRPNYWVAPRGGWGKGAVELVEIPTPAEWNDNIDVFWVPEQPLAEGEERRIEYTLTASLDAPSRPPLARTRSTRIGPGKQGQLYVLDFTGRQLDADPDALRADVTTTAGTIRDLVLMRNEPEGGQRCAFQFVDGGAESAELRVRLLRGEQPVTETLVLSWVKP
jgi:periplasmic glucans biosynthesis protein